MNRMRETQLEITVMDYDKIGRNDTIGKVIVFIINNTLRHDSFKKVLLNKLIKFKLIV